MFEWLKKRRCKHGPYGLRFIRVVPEEEFEKYGGKRYEYECVHCGELVHTFVPVNCNGCANLWFNNSGQAECLGNYEYQCFKTFNMFFEPIKQSKGVRNGRIRRRT